MVTKVVHLEIVSKLSTGAFQTAVDRFYRQSKFCADVFSDCATNFVGAARELREIFQFIKGSYDKIANYLSLKSIKWPFNTP